MHIPTKKLSNGFEIPVYGIGTWQMGGRFTRDLTNDDKADIQALKAALENGITHIDTAEAYADGHAETLVGKAIEGYDRSKLFLASKVKVDNLTYDKLLHCAKESLRRLNTSYINLYMLHQYSLTIPLKETMRAMDTLVEEGLIKHIGVSNFTIQEFEEAQSYTKYKIVANQLHLNLKYREAVRKGLLDYCQKKDVMLIAWRPLQKGLLLNDKENILTTMAEKYQVTPSQIAINWLISLPNVVTISKTTNLSHLKENLGALTFTMEKEDTEKLTIDFPNQEDVSDTVPLH